MKTGGSHYVVNHPYSIWSRLRFDALISSMQDAGVIVLLVDFAADSRSAGPSIRENFTDVPSLTHATLHTHVSTYAYAVRDFRKLPARMTRLIVDSPPTREIDSQRRLLRGKCNYAVDYAPRLVTMRVFPFACLADDTPAYCCDFAI